MTKMIDSIVIEMKEFNWLLVRQWLVFCPKIAMDILERVYNDR